MHAVAKDCCSAGQSLRVAEYAGEIAKRAGFSVRQQTDIYMAALLHDVGKLGVPDEIITKNAALTEEEMCVCDIADALKMEQSTISHQLRVLRQNKLVRVRRDGKQMYYALDDDHVKKIIEMGVDHILE